MTAEAPPRSPPLRDVCNGRHWLARAGAPWRLMPNDLPPGAAVAQPPPRWLRAGVCEASVPDWRVVRRLAAGRPGPPSAALVASRTRPSTPESGPRAGADGATRQRRRKVPLAVETLGPLLAWQVTAANAQARAQGGQLTPGGPAVTGAAVEVACVDPGSTGDQPAPAAAGQGLQRTVVKRPQAPPGVVLLPRRWVIARRFAWAARVRRWARADDRWPEPLRGVHVLVCAILMRTHVVALMGQRA